MIIKPDLVRRIKEYFNLNIYETKVWLALLSKGIASAGEIAEISGVPRSRTYDVLESLEKAGFAIIKIGKPVKYISVKPTEIIEKMKSKTLNEAQEKVKSLSNLKETQEYVELEQLHNSGISPIKSVDITGSLRGRANIISRIRELVENAEKEVFICTSVTDFEDKSRVLVPALDKVTKKDIRVRLALSGDTEKIKKFNTRFNLKARPIDSKARFFMTDKKEILFMVTHENSDEEMGVWLQSSFFTESLSNLLESNLKNSNGNILK
ncbi:TrmB family transcriptional regulator [Candidatus Pacearchaeota archaeon]|nr:TrmB family transcriptional regulator [Candidatus Pacearchaeota archaeon]